MVVMVVVIAAVPRARPVMAAAGVLRAAFVVDAEHRIHTNPVFAGPTGIAILIDAALGADIVRLAVAADESVAAIDLRRGVSPSDSEKSAGFAHALAAIGHRGADTRIADLAIAAVAVRAALGAVTGLADDAAHWPNAAVQLRIGTGLQLRDAKVRALTQRYAFVVAAFLTLVALAEAGPFGASGAGAAVGIFAAFDRHALAIAVAGGAPWAVRIGATFVALPESRDVTANCARLASRHADATLAGITQGTIVVVTARGAVVVAFRTATTSVGNRNRIDAGAVVANLARTAVGVRAAFDRFALAVAIAG
jgi:hypothetical protein